MDIEEMNIEALEEETYCENCDEELIVGEKVLRIRDTECVDYYYCLGCAGQELDEIIEHAKSLIEQAEQLKQVEQ